MSIEAFALDCAQDLIVLLGHSSRLARGPVTITTACGYGLSHRRR
jgi:hypothetical protein